MLRALRYIGPRAGALQRATFRWKKWRVTIAAYGYCLKDNRSHSTPTGQFIARCQARVRGIHYPRFPHGPGATP